MKFVVTGCGRSGTKYAAHVLLQSGLVCGHEDVVNRWDSTFTPQLSEAATRFTGDSSFVAAPVAARLAADGVTVVHLLRPPLDVIRSVVGMGHLGNATMPYVQFVDRHAGVFEQPPGPRRAAAYWLRWNALIEPHAHLRWDVTSITDGDIAELCGLVGHRFVRSRAREALANIPTTTNHRDRAEWVTLDHLGPLAGQVVETAARYGLALEV